MRATPLWSIMNTIIMFYDSSEGILKNKLSNPIGSYQVMLLNGLAG